jgi:hypothetical protein
VPSVAKDVFEGVKDAGLKEIETIENNVVNKFIETGNNLKNKVDGLDGDLLNLLSQASTLLLNFFAAKDNLIEIRDGADSLKSGSLQTAIKSLTVTLGHSDCQKIAVKPKCDEIKIMIGQYDIETLVKIPDLNSTIKQISGGCHD